MYIAICPSGQTALVGYFGVVHHRHVSMHDTAQRCVFTYMSLASRRPHVCTHHATCLVFMSIDIFSVHVYTGQPAVLPDLACADCSTQSCLHTCLYPYVHAHMSMHKSTDPSIQTKVAGTLVLSCVWHSSIHRSIHTSIHMCTHRSACGDADVTRSD